MASCVRDDAPELLTTEQVMDRLLAQGPLRHLAAQCVLPAVRCGNEWRFRRSDLEAWIARQPRPAATVKQ
jgi:excisionase family DNA binding protein